MLLWFGAVLTADSEDGGVLEVFALFFGWAFSLAWFVRPLLVFRATADFSQIVSFMPFDTKMQKRYTRIIQQTHR